MKILITKAVAFIPHGRGPVVVHSCVQREGPEGATAQCSLRELVHAADGGGVAQVVDQPWSRVVVPSEQP